MKTIWIVDHYSSEPKYGGISRQHDFALELSRRGYRTIILSSAFSHYTHQYIADMGQAEMFESKIAENTWYVYLKTTPYQENGGLHRVRNMFSFLNAVLKHYKEVAQKFGRPDVVMGASVHPLAWIAAYKIARKYGVRFVAEVRDLWPEMWLLSKEKKPYDPMVCFFGAIESWAYKKADLIIYSMLYGDKYICDKKGICRDKTMLIQQPLDCKRYDVYAEENYEYLPEEVRNFIRDSFVCVFTGYYMEYEGVYVMLEAAKTLLSRGIPVKMLFLGSGKEETGMHTYVKEHGLTNVLVGGRVSKEWIPALLRHADICLAHCAAKGSEESFKYGVSKNKVNEYLYSDSCIIYGRSDEKDPVALYGAGYVVRPFDSEQFADKIEQVYRMSPEERAQFGKNGKIYIENNHAVEILTNQLLTGLFPQDISIQ